MRRTCQGDSVIELIILALIAGLFACFLNLRSGIFGTLLIGFLQDPLRKIVPDEPVYFSALVAVFALTTFVGGRLQHVMLPIHSIPDWNTRLRSAVLAFFFMVLFQCVAAFAYTGSVFLAGIGFMAYLSPFPALQMSYSFARDMERIRSFLWLYLGANTLMSAGVYLSLLDLDWTILRSVGENLVVYSWDAGAIVLPAGFYRVPELAAWHAASGACIALALGLASRRQTVTGVSVVLALFFFGAVLLTGRRKFLIEIAIYLPIFLYFAYRFKLGGARFLGAIVLATLLGVGLSISSIATDDTISSFRDSSLRGQARGDTIVDESIDRLAQMTVDTLPYVIEQNGFLGSGAGSGSQGAQYFGGGSDRVGLAAEGGLGKVLAELGVPGLLIVLWLVFKILAYTWQTLTIVARGDTHIARLTMGLASFLAANSIVFITAHQAFGDLFVLLILGFILGFIFAIRRLVTAGNGDPARTAAAPGLPASTYYPEHA
jgi:hypothetical protein